MTANTTRLWAWIHKWSSLVCTLFMLLLCLTGLPLIFHHEIDHALGDEVQAPQLPATAGRASLDKVTATAMARYPGKRPTFVSQEVDDDRVWYVTLSDSPTSENDMKQVAVDARSGLPLAEPKLEGGLMNFIFRLHADLFLGLPGMLFLGFMGLLLMVAIVSGVVLYWPFMRKLEFGTVRRTLSARIKWLDFHNMLGIITLVWAAVVTFTGIINTLADPVISIWRNGEVSAMTAPYKGLPVPKKFGSLRTAVDAAMARMPGMAVKFIAFPGTTFSSPHHYAVFLRGDAPLTAKLLQPVLVDAVTGKVTDSRPLPWYVTALLLSQPLHFGDYGGLPLKLLWALLDVALIVVLGSGIYLWLRRGSKMAANPVHAVKPAATAAVAITAAGTSPQGLGVAGTAILRQPAALAPVKKNAGHSS
ncbi:MAG: PepSY-associated TM helix domain-containing protein [Janthinobacterium lividum]